MSAIFTSEGFAGHMQLNKLNAIFDNILNMREKLEKADEQNPNLQRKLDNQVVLLQKQSKVILKDLSLRFQ